ncbi:RNA polymerase sigma factor [Ramlibacter sp. Leaf400]|uniref:RNA polymerase sigma factor n=1 Tax=Ramlibacter sp. Leaf400 TaxID=1736365 RepID=UPI0007023846|nr:sigma-70 family RNA polymerase sigma factor [Ramlibacter sp. Leaf400]KQT10934.1 RNA polymerase subunit sigma-24 [Ramlibacter sp. Leaf400]
MSSTPTLQDLMAAAARGDHAAFAQVYERTHAHLFGVALRILGRHQSAEDVLQEAFINIWKNAAAYRSSVGGQDIQPMTWLIAIVRNKALDALRSRTRRQETELDEEQGEGASTQAAAPSALDLFSAATQALRIEGCMGGLDGTHRQSLALAYYQGLTHSEVAARMGAPLGSVKAWIRRGLDKLKDCLKAQGVAA